MHFYSGCLDARGENIACGKRIIAEHCLNGQIVKAICSISRNLSSNEGILEMTGACQEGSLVKTVVFICQQIR